jgi:nitrogen-specific signal transduction histidine kinase
VDVGEMVSGMTELLERSLGVSIQIKAEIPGSLPAMHVDLNQLELAILNLAANARDPWSSGRLPQPALQPFQNESILRYPLSASGLAS